MKLYILVYDETEYTWDMMQARIIGVFSLPSLADQAKLDDLRDNVLNQAKHYFIHEYTLDEPKRD
jgi:hypothetical protein